jgi:deoxyribose-phosphate aldolase
MLDKLFSGYNKIHHMSIARFIDHTILRPNTSIEDIKKLCIEARQYSFASVCIPPYFISEAFNLLKGSGVKVATVIGFPFGYSHYTAKVSEAQHALKDGAVEIDMVMNIAAFKNADENYLKDEIITLLKPVYENKGLLKLIIETGLLSKEEIISCCRFYKNFNIDFLKTSTGYAEKGADVEVVQLMRQHLPEHIQIKASGGIKTFEFANALLKAGATRLGCSASVAIVTGEEQNIRGY